jgi:hypothetical protein
MKINRHMILDRSAFTITSLHNDVEDKAYWLNKTPEERMEAVEQSRQIIYGYDPTTIRLQRFFEVAELKTS